MNSKHPHVGVHNQVEAGRPPYVRPGARRASEMHPALNQLQQPAQQATQPLAGPFVV